MIVQSYKKCIKILCLNCKENRTVHLRSDYPPVYCTLRQSLRLSSGAPHRCGQTKATLLHADFGLAAPQQVFSFPRMRAVVLLLAVALLGVRAIQLSNRSESMKVNHEPSYATNATSCAVFGAPGQCLNNATCVALGNHSSYAGYCPGPADIECCIVTPNTANNPPFPPGYVLMQQSQVTPEMTNWAVMILYNTTAYPMFSTTRQTFGSLQVLALVEWHPPDFQNSSVHRGVTLFLPATASKQKQRRI